MERRRLLLEIARRRDIPVVEDNCYGDVHFDGAKPPSLYALSDYDKIVYLCSLSKILAPGLRLGYLHAKPPLLDAILARRHDAGGNYLAAAVVAELYKERRLGDHRGTERGAQGEEEPRRRRLWPRPVPTSASRPNPPGGLFVWVRFPEDVDQAKLLQLATERNFRYAPGANFHIRGEPVPYLRLAFGHVPDDVIRDGMPVLAQCLREARTSNEPPGFTGLFG